MVRYCLQLVVTRDYFYCLQSYHSPVNYLSTTAQLTNRLLCFCADGGFVYYKRVRSPSFLVWSQSLIVIITSWFAIALDEIRTRRILREKADCKPSTHRILHLAKTTCGSRDVRALRPRRDYKLASRELEPVLKPALPSYTIYSDSLPTSIPAPPPSYASFCDKRISSCKYGGIVRKHSKYSIVIV